ncbi:chemotaxis protein CheW [Vibrio scophthalmi]|uniref:chemotaxis protein CheW n=1 Tax=Vibrio scophthalmi TaxID=45658 RepID=UPI002285047A|nr:chemotaxis protein CheW [Vibrio scophthalmi]MCY9803027.1 chemotaxis protein CheW [Vibrio scophthalmi]
MSEETLLSSEQALDDYFTSLLFEDEELQALVTPDLDDTVLAEPEPEPEANDYTLEPMIQTAQETYFYHPVTAEIEVPNLEDVERLLKQLEASNPVEELELDQVMDQNTVQIAQEVQAKQLVDEIQEWDVEPYVEEVPEVELELATFDVAQEQVAEPVFSQPTMSEAEPELTTDIQSIPETQAGGLLSGTWQSTQREQDFQVLYFDVNGVTFAVPLDELGGIHQLSTLSHLIGRPTWYLGLQSTRDAQFDVVDTAKWVMPDKLLDDEYKEQYKYIVMLGASLWGLASTQLMGTELLNTEKVRWRETAGKRPWLAGMVKEKMCALIHVEALITMLNAGLDVKALDN